MGTKRTMRIDWAMNIMGHELPVQSVRTATEVKAMYEAADSLLQSSYEPNAIAFASGVKNTIAWMMKNRHPAPVEE